MPGSYCALYLSLFTLFGVGFAASNYQAETLLLHWRSPFHPLELSLSTAQFAKSLAMLGSSEDNTALSRALSQLAEVEEKIEQLHQEQANNDFFLLAELLSDYIRLLSVVRVSIPCTLLISGKFLWSKSQWRCHQRMLGLIMQFRACQIFWLHYFLKAE